MKRFYSMLAAGVISAGLPLCLSAQDGAKQDIKDAGHETKNAAKKTGHAVAEGTEDAAHGTAHVAKKTGHAVKQGTKKTVHAAASGTEKGADKVKEKTEP